MAENQNQNTKIQGKPIWYKIKAKGILKHEKE